MFKIYRSILEFLLKYKSGFYLFCQKFLGNLPFMLFGYIFASYGISILVFFTKWDLLDLYMLWLCPPGIFEPVQYIDLDLILNSKDKVDTLRPFETFEEIPESNRARWFRWGVGFVITGMTLYHLYGTWF